MGRNCTYFKIGEDSLEGVRRKTWLLKCIMMWCSLQILFCNWKMAVLYDGLRHHTHYIYRGVIDFYISMWFFALYSVCTRDKRSALEFDEFHYYYTSMMPFFHHRAHDYNGLFNLCALVLTEDNIGKEPFDDGSADKLGDVQRALALIFNRVTGFWNSDMEGLCLSIHGLARGGPLDPFFIRFDRILAHRDAVLDDAFELDIKSFCDTLTPYWFWFHFRYITMGVVANVSTEYLQKQGMPLPAAVLWTAWCRTFSSQVTQLSLRMYLRQKTELIRLRALGYNNMN
jgi:hypothetical protein